MVNEHIYKHSHILEASRDADIHAELHRKACDITGKLGSLYDIKTDRFIKHYSLLREPNWYIQDRTPTCYWWSSDKNNASKVPTDKLDIEDELCLSLYLGLCGNKLNGRASLINYEKPINQRTIFLLYSYNTREQWLPTNSFCASIFFPNGSFDTFDTNASHIVRGIQWGFEVLFVIQIPHTIEKMADKSDIVPLLNNICDTLKQRHLLQINLTDNEHHLWSKLDVHILTTSPYLSFDQKTHISSIIYCIQRFKSYWRLYEYPLVYILQPVKWIYPIAPNIVYDGFANDFSNESKQIQRTLYLLQNTLNELTFSLRLFQEIDKEKFLSVQSRDIDNKIYRLKENRRELLQNLITTLLEVRDGKQNFHKLSTIIQEHQDDSLSPSFINSLIEECGHLCNKARLIYRLRTKYFEYLQITDDKTPSKQQQISKLFFNSIQPVSIVCSSDIFIKQDKKLWISSCRELIKKKSQNPNVRLIYADLSYCTHEDIKNTMIISSDSTTNKATSPSIPEIQEKTDINVLLLGETGVGKSTFINAFVNYLTFDSLEQAASSEPVVLIPVSFLLTTNDKLDEFIVKFGDVDANEDHDHPGQSVTQHCRSYVFDISDKLRLRFIDTPGVGDTRGIDQDQKNIDHILSYINNFPHINAVCILLQPNIKRLSVFFRSCLLQLFTYLTPAALDNIVFCFTNARSTFFAPGDTAPILKSFLKELPIAEIPFSRKNSFCFDSESFRYLAAVKNNFIFDEYQEEECLKSWTGSVTESERLFKFLCTLKPYYANAWQSTKHAKIEINTMIRPIMEAFRTVLFNMILQNQQRYNLQVVLNPKPLDDPRSVNAICYRGDCSFTRIQCDNFFIAQYPMHQLDCKIIEINKECKMCQCSTTAHQLIDYELNYEVQLTMEPTKPIDDKEINRWLNLCVTFANFLDSNEMFFRYFDQFINEERLLKMEEKPTEDLMYMTNSQLYDILSSTKTAFETYVRTINGESTSDLDKIYELIKYTKSLSDIKSQLDAIKEGQMKLIKLQEQFIEIPSRCTGILNRITEQSAH